MTTIAKVARILDLYTPATPVWGVTDVARALEIPRSTAHSLLSALTSAGLLQQPGRGLYELGWRAFELGQVHRVTSGLLIEIARPVILELARRHAESVCLAVYDREALIFIDKVVGDDPLSVVGPRIGVRHEPHTYASGRLLMAAGPDAAVDTYTAGRQMRTRSTGAIVTPDGLWRQIHQIRDEGVSLDFGEAILDVGCVAAPVTGTQGQVLASVSVSAPERRFRENLAELTASVKAAARTLSQRLRERRPTT